MRLILIFIVLLSFNTAHTQNTKPISGHVIYSTEFIENKTLKESKSWDLFLMMQNKIKDVKFELIFNNNQSLFQIYEPSIINLNNTEVQAATITIGKGEFYKNLLDSVFLRKVKSGGEELIIALDPENHLAETWTIKEDESKTIQGFLCYKAIRQKTVTNSKGDHKFTIEAWFSPEIPVGLGPKEFGDLPGLILELKDTHYVFYAQDIKTSEDTNLKIKAFKGKQIKESDYNEQIKKRIERFKS